MRIKIGHYIWNPLILIRNILYLIMILWMVWMTISYAEIVCKNIGPNPTYWEYNFWTMFLK